ncbi:MAG: hypothetical protein AB7F86_06950 [Bdellovibrionales bacterium]
MNELTNYRAKQKTSVVDMKNRVWIVQHSIETEEGEALKFIGVFSSRAKAKEAVGTLKKKPGFRIHPRRFHISRLELDHVSWTEGFVRAYASDTLAKKYKD